jgi:hypothetical protein
LLKLRMFEASVDCVGARLRVAICGAWSKK